MRDVKRNWYHSSRGVDVIYLKMKKKEASTATSLPPPSSSSSPCSRSERLFSTCECTAGNSLHVDEKVHQSDTREIISLIRSFFFCQSRICKASEREGEREKERQRGKKRRKKKKKSTNGFNDKTLSYYYDGLLFPYINRHQVKRSPKEKVRRQRTEDGCMYVKDKEKQGKAYENRRDKWRKQ